MRCFSVLRMTPDCAPTTANVPIARQLQGDFIADYSIWPLIKPRVLRIVPRPVYCVWE